MKRYMVYVVAVSLLLIVFLYYWFGIKQVKIDPEAEIKVERTYELEFWDYLLPLVWEDGTVYQEFVQRIIADFEAQHPNIKINYYPLAFTTGRELLTQALREGKPPDIYSEPFAENMVCHQGFQIPVSSYLGPEERENYHPGVLALLEAEGEVWAWPAWIAPMIWVGNCTLLEECGLDVAQLQAIGWRWEQFLVAGRQLAAKELGQNISYLVGPGIEQLFINLLQNNGITALPTSLGEKQKFGDAVAETGALVANLVTENLWHDYQLGSESWVERFWEGEAALVGPVYPWVIRGPGSGLHKIKREFDYVFLPPPHQLGAREYNEPALAVVRVFRQQNFQGSDRIKAAMEFARYFSRHQGNAVASFLWSLPAYKSENPTVLENELSYNNIRFLRQRLSYLLPLPFHHATKNAERMWRQEVLPGALAKLLQGNLSPQEFADNVAAGLK
ncbi:MAG: ABC transporter substrate-binding protein [bacterium]|jgi:ABC-type glycerol-3-phosphate transport system substrate-binding protein